MASDRYMRIKVQACAMAPVLDFLQLEAIG